MGFKWHYGAPLVISATFLYNSRCHYYQPPLTTQLKSSTCSVKHYNQSINQSIKVFHHFNMYKKSTYCKILRPLSGQWNADIPDVAFHHALKL